MTWLERLEVSTWNEVLTRKDDELTDGEKSYLFTKRDSYISFREREKEGSRDTTKDLEKADRSQRQISDSRRARDFLMILPLDD